MNRQLKTTAIALTVSSMLLLTGCGNKALEDANTAAEAYNAAAESFNETASPYNDAVKQITAANEELQNAIDSAQATINSGEAPFDESTLEALKTALSEAASQKIDTPPATPEYTIITVDKDAKRAELKELTEKANTDIEEMAAYIVPDVPEVPDYSVALQTLTSAQTAYKNSVQGLKQVTTPSDEFVIERLQTIETVMEIEPVTEDHDPNGNLNKQGGYIGCVYFSDSQVNRDNLYIEAGEDGVVDVGTDGGGAIEVYSNVEDAQRRNDYLATLDGGWLSSGSHYVVGTCVVRTSDYLTGTQQLDLTEAITQALILVK